MKTYIIDHKNYGQKATFKSLREAQSFIQGCGPEFQTTKFREDSGDIFDEDGHIVGNVESHEFADTLLALRQKTGLSQVRAARLAGVPRSTWQSWEAGVRTPPSYVQQLIVRVCERPLGQGDRDALETLNSEKQ